MTGQQEWTDWSCSVVVRTERDRDLAVAVDVVRAVMDEVALSADRFRPHSDLSRVNAASGRLVAVEPLTVQLVEIALDAAAATGGAVDPTVGAALLALGYDADIDVVRDRVPTRPVDVGPRGCWRSVRVDADLGLVGVPPGAALDLGSLAKAWAVDEALDLAAQRVEGAVLVSIGGDLAVRGAPEDGWEIAVAETRDGPGELVTLDAGALATSSSTGRRWESGHHIVDPRTGRCADGAYRTATVWAPTTVAANLLSTWTLVDPVAARADILARGSLARLVHRDGGVERVAGWPAGTPITGLAS
ncbi:FAD:protein FMN transferase [Nocardioides ultimimeridianus]